MVEEQREIAGVVCSGLGEGAMFTQLPWVQAEFRAKLGFVPSPGTLNLQMTDRRWRELYVVLAREAGIPIVPAEGFCAARCFRVTLGDTVEGAIVIPEVEGYPDDKVEIIAPVSIRERLGLQDGDRVWIRIAVPQRETITPDGASGS